MNTKTSKLTQRFESALVYAHQLHQFQLRKGSEIPYISHLLSVSALVLEDGGSEDEAIAALLHDAVEDQGGAETLTEIREKFGDKVAQIVNGCTESEVIPKPPWKERKERYLQHLREASPEVYRVALADKLHNARSILFDYSWNGETVWNKFKTGKEGTLWFFRQVLAVPPPPTLETRLYDELKQVIQTLENL